MDIILDIGKKNKSVLGQGGYDVTAIVRFAAILLLSLFFAFSVQAYMEETNDGSTKLTAGEINTNFNRLNNQGMINLKKLKQIDEMMAKSPTAGDGSAQNVAEVSQLVAERNDEKVRLESEQAKKTAKLLNDKSSLRRKTSSAAVQMINEVAALSVRDRQLAAELFQQLRRSR